MVKLNVIYTRTGDDGSTGLADGSRRAKDDARVAAYGTVDEANSVIGIVRLAADAETDAMLARIQNDLFDVGADLATPGDDFAADSKSLRATASQVDRLEAEIDAMNATLAPLSSFILPGGTAAAAHLHLARTVVRRAERLAVTAALVEVINPTAIRYLNRLSDHLFVLARVTNRSTGDVLWVPGAGR
ncbi:MULTISPECIES: cob(I)yrinic acid a,c-diamide adenosyltransferase [Sphingosinicellaceae]|uniref:cob(I)yrinic acid a,c-diamide adenosyltransferase n=1 Tax=Sphingosinicellaceae TaxID=2820280 RepID=UPI001C1E7EEF|nr:MULTISPECIES: cob(I)yrinic acid a,c-diamide adenosyltransferase [Polymorphobacter]QYE35310.1 cob(I)yrinic acid a,c-diamide adenosyltransferase [Polymorphobacter sp. PAMC 29334]UAJ11385.1 cob(I)yrinic acid a,c-diamide adenosyltransferase [Polymorphobacter megasporae]